MYKCVISNWLCFHFSDRHRSFKLKLPSLRKELRYKSKSVDITTPDPENPPIPEEAVPLNQIHGSSDTITQSNVLPASTNLFMETSGGTDQSERTKVDIASINENNLLLPNVTSVTYMRRASSLEGLDFQKNQEKQDRSDVGKLFFFTIFCTAG